MLKPHFLKASAIAALLGFAALSGCVSSHVIVGKVRPAISPDQVQLYLHPPAGKYEEVALLDSNSKHSFSFTALLRLAGLFGLPVLARHGELEA